MRIKNNYIDKLLLCCETYTNNNHKQISNSNQTRVKC